MAGQELGKEIIGAAAGEFGADCVTGVFRFFPYLPQRTRQPNRRGFLSHSLLFPSLWCPDEPPETTAASIRPRHARNRGCLSALATSPSQGACPNVLFPFVSCCWCFATDGRRWQNPRITRSSTTWPRASCLQVCQDVVKATWKRAREQGSYCSPQPRKNHAG